MKRFIFLMSVIFVAVACKELDIVQYEYQSTTMMGRKVITIRQDSVITTFNGRGESTRTARTTDPSEWLALANSIKDVELSEIANLESPTNKRATDAAPYGTIIITTKDSVFTSAGFDGKQPHEMLMPLMNEILKISEKN